MKHTFQYYYLIAFLLLSLGNVQIGRNEPEAKSSKEEAEKIYLLIMEYRKEKGLPSIPLSKDLCLVAETHVRDLQVNNPITNKCNMHSWSSKGKWTACCYTGDHSNAECMWSKPRELTNYKGDGYEIACGSGDMPAEGYMNASDALDCWKGSPGHNDVIINEDIWANHPWKAIGVGVYGGYAVVWFGEE